jgi:malate dehydrogenase
MNRKVTVVGGAGNVGATVARAIADKELADVVIIDIADQKAKGVALDMYQACPIEGSDSRIIGAGADEAGWKETANSDVVVITSGVPRKPGMSRDDLLQVNYKIMQSVTEQVVKYSPNTIIVPVANPLDAMCQAVYRLSKFPRERVIGMAGVLDSARMRTFIAMETGVSVENIHAFVLGGHGDTMVPLPRYSTIAGIPLPDYPGLTKETIDAIGVRTANGGARSPSWSAPAPGTRRARPRGDGRDHPQGQEEDRPVLGVPPGEYGINDLFVGVPVKLGARGVEQIIQIKLTPEEDAALQKSAAAVKELTDIIKV